MYAINVRKISTTATLQLNQRLVAAAANSDVVPSCRAGYIYRNYVESS
jgi:sulfur carrier protein ThiS